VVKNIAFEIVFGGIASFGDVEGLICLMEICIAGGIAVLVWGGDE
jgi:hypothetical protein